MLNFDVLKFVTGTVVVVLGWLAAHYFATKRDDRTRRQQAVLRLRERQIEELYGPLQSLIDQVFAVWRTRQRILDSAPDKLGAEAKQRIRQFVWAQYFRPLHQQIRDILRAKQHLIEGGRVPDSFKAYMAHSTQEEFQQLLWTELQIDTAFVAGTPWPKQFYQDVTQGLELVRSKYEIALREVEVGTRGGVFQ